MREGGTGRGPKGPTWGGSSGDRGWEVRLAEEMARKSPWGLREQMEKALCLGQRKTLTGMGEGSRKGGEVREPDSEGGRAGGPSGTVVAVEGQREAPLPLPPALGPLKSTCLRVHRTTDLLPRDATVG